MTIDVKGGNRHALRLLIGQPARQTFATGDETVFLHWAQRIPTVIDASKLKVGDRIIVRVRAAGGSTLQQVEATAAKRVADREPKQQEQSQSAQSLSTAGVRRAAGDAARLAPWSGIDVRVHVLVLQHIACEPPGVFEDVLLERGATVHRVELDEGEPLPADGSTGSTPSSRWAAR